MKNSKKLHFVFNIPEHGLGHLAQTIPVVNELLRLKQNVKITIVSGISASIIKQRLPKCQHIERSWDFGMVMASSIDVLPGESMLQYQKSHQHWKENLHTCKQFFDALSPNLLISNIAYFPLLATQQSAYPSIAMCSLNWADIFYSYCQKYQGSDAIYQQIKESYNAADCFYKITPCMPMSWLEKSIEVDPIAQRGQSVKNNLLQNIDSPHAQLGLVALGGVKTEIPFDQWPSYADQAWLVPFATQCERGDLVSIDQLPYSYLELLCSVDSVITKPGYGMFTEAAYNSTPVLYVKRGDWPEESFLISWLEKNGVCQAITREQLFQGNFQAELSTIMTQENPIPPVLNGAEQIVHSILNLIFYPN